MLRKRWRKCDVETVLRDVLFVGVVKAHINIYKYISFFAGLAERQCKHIPCLDKISEEID